MAIKPTGNGDYTLDADWKEIAAVKNHLREGNVSGLVGVGDEVGRAALFGSASKFEGRNVATINMRPTTSVPYPQGKADVDWDRTESFNRVPLVEADPHGLVDLHASQPGIQHGALRHYLSTKQFGGSEGNDLFDQQRGMDNDHPVIFQNEDSGERTLLSGHHRTTAALISGHPLLARVVRGHVE